MERDSQRDPDPGEGGIMAEQRVTLSSFQKGILRRGVNPLDFPPDGLDGGSNVDLSEGGLKTRPGSSICSTDLPYGTVRAIKQFRAPTNQKKFIVAQVNYEPQWVTGTATAAVRYEHSAVWDTARGRMLVFGGYDEASEYLNDLLSYSPVTDAWTALTPTGGPPPARAYHGAFYDPADDAMYVILGQGAAGLLTDVWKYDCELNTWAEVTTTGTPPSHFRGAYRTTDRTFIIYEGPTVAFAKFTVATAAWSTVATTFSGDSGNYPYVDNWALRCGYDAAGDQIIIFGGGHEAPCLYPARLNLSTNAYSLGAAFPDADGLANFGAICCGSKFVAAGGVTFFGSSIGSAGVLSVYDITGDAWTTNIPQGTLAERLSHTLVITDESAIIAFAGITDTGLSPTILGDVYILEANLCTGNTGGASDLYASPDTLPGSNLQFTKIYELGEGAGVVTMAALNDRYLITEGIKKVPLVWGGAMSAIGEDWIVPKAVLARPNGTDAYDVTAQVCDKDDDTVADLGNLLGNGDLLVCLDMSKVSALHLAVGTPNTGIPVVDQTFSETLEFTKLNQVDRYDMKATITNWVQDSGAGGHFTDGVNPVTIGPGYTNPNVIKGLQVTIGGTVRTIMAVTGNGSGASGVTLDASQASGSVDTIIGTDMYAVYTDIKGPITNWVQDAAATGHFTDGSTTLSLGTGNTVPQIVPGLIVTIGGTEYTIQSITGNGTGSGAVTLSATVTSGAVTSIRTATAANSGLTVTGSDGVYSSLLTKTLDQPQVFSYSSKISVRQAIRGSEFGGSGTVIRATFAAYAATMVGQLVNAGFKMVAASIVQRTGTTGYVGTTTPTPFTFNGGAAGCTVVAAGEITTDPLVYAINPANDYLVIMDFEAIVASGAVGTQTNYNRNMIARGLTGGGGYAIIFNAYSASSIGLPAGGTVTSAFYPSYPYTIGVKKIETAPVAGTAVPDQLQVATTNNTSRIPTYAISNVNGVTVTETLNGTSKLYNAFSFDGRLTWWVYLLAAWKQIVKQDAGTWKYLNSSGVWTAAAVNDVYAALRDAFGVAANQMSGTAVNAMASADWTAENGLIPSVTQYLDIAIGLQADASSNRPYCTRFVLSYNDVGTTTIEGFINGQWTALAWADGTEVNDIPWAQSGIISGAEVTLDYTVQAGVPGYFIRILTNGTSPATTLRRILYKAPCQPLANIGDGQPSIANGFIYVDSSTNGFHDFSRAVSDNTIANFSEAAVPMAADDFIYVGFKLRFNAIEMTPGEYGNQNSSSVTVEYWNGTSWVSVDSEDGTAGNTTMTFSTRGKIAWTLPTDWKMNIPFDSHGLWRAYWIRLRVSAALSSATTIAECRVYEVPDPIKKHRFVAVAGDRVFLAGRPDGESQVDVSGRLAEYMFTGPNSGSWDVGGQDAIVALSAAYDTLFAWKPESVHQWTGEGFAGAEAARHTPINSQVVIKATSEGKSGLFFFNGNGGFGISGLHTDSTWNTAQIAELTSMLDWWDSNVAPRLDLNYLHLACGEYYPKKNWLIWSVPMILTGSSQTTNNVLVIFDLSLGCWYPPFQLPFGVASMCTAYTYNANAPQGLGDLILLAGTYDGRVVRLFDPSTTLDLGADIPAWAETGWLTFGDPETEKRLNKLRVYGSTDADNVTVSVFIDGNNVAQANPFTLTKLSGLTGKQFEMAWSPDNTQGRAFKFRIEAAKAMHIYGMQLDIFFHTDIQQYGGA